MPGKFIFPGILPFIGKLSLKTSLNSAAGRSAAFYGAYEKGGGTFRSPPPFISHLRPMGFLRLTYGSEQLHLLLYGILNRLEAGSQKLTGVEALALLILAFLNILTGSGCEGKLALGVYIDLGNAQGNRFLDHVSRNTCAAMKHQGKVSGLALNGIQGLEA